MKWVEVRGWYGVVLGFGLSLGCVGQIGSGAEQLGHEQDEMRASAEDVLAWRRDGEWWISPRLDGLDGATRVGALVGVVQPSSLPRLEVRGWAGGVPITDWTPLRSTWQEEDQHVAVAELQSAADEVELRLSIAAREQLVHLRWNASSLDPTEDEAVVDDETEAIGSTREALRRELSEMGIVTRAGWGARATRCRSANAVKTRMAIHHTVTGASDPARQLRGIQRYHMDSLGWCDVGYHFLVGQDGRIYEGRPLNLLGAHVARNNTGNIGIAFVGCFHSSGCGALSGSRRPNDASLASAARLVRRLSDLYDIAIDVARVRGHKDHSGQSTSCPGAYLDAELPALRTRARSGGSSPAPAPEPSPTPPTSGGASCTHSFGGTYVDRACSTSWQCCDGLWDVRGACGSCACVESSGTEGCSSDASSGPPPGSSCLHSYGGRYANTACSPGWQCCDGRWNARGACGGCYCEESSGTRGCGI